MEGGAWGIVIVISAFMIQVLTFGTTASIGVYNIEFLDYFTGSSVGVSLIGSVNFGVYLGSGPIVSFLMTKFCYRKIAFCGSALVLVGLLGMPFLPYIPTMCLFFGVLTGFGNCCTYIPSHVLSGLYYDKYRSIATGVSTSGSGLGGAVLPVLVGFLIDVYSWKGSIIFLAGLNLHLFIFAALLRYPPLPSVAGEQKTPKPKLVAEEYVADRQQESNVLVTPRKRRKDEPRFEMTSSASERPSGSAPDRPKSYASCASYQTIANYDNFGVDLSEIDFIDKLSMSTTVSSRDNISGRLQTSVSRSAMTDSWTDKMPNMKLRDSSFVKSAKLPETNRQEHHRISFLDVIYPHSISAHSLFALGSRGSTVIYIDTMRLLEARQSVSEMEKSASGTSIIPRSSRHVYIFTNYRFNIYFFSNIMWNAGYAIIQSFAPEFLQDKGLTLMEAAWLSGAFGLASFVGGVAGGVSGNIETINRQMLYTAACLVMGVATIGFPQFQHIALYTLLLVISGLAFGVILGLLIVVLTDLVGVESLGNGLGYLMLSNGLGTFLGPPVASVMKDATGGFGTGLSMAGGLCVLGGLIMFLMPCRHYCNQNGCKGKQPTKEECKMVSL